MTKAVQKAMQKIVVYVGKSGKAEKRARGKGRSGGSVAERVALVEKELGAPCPVMPSRRARLDATGPACAEWGCRVPG